MAKGGRRRSSRKRAGDSAPSPLRGGVGGADKPGGDKSSDASSYEQENLSRVKQVSEQHSAKQLVSDQHSAFSQAAKEARGKHSAGEKAVSAQQSAIRQMRERLRALSGGNKAHRLLKRTAAEKAIGAQPSGEQAVRIQPSVSGQSRNVPRN